MHSLRGQSLVYRAACEGTDAKTREPNAKLASQQPNLLRQLKFIHK